MALSMDEQRILDEIERALASADPGLATRMSSFGTRGVLTLRARRIRLLASLGTLLVVAAVSLVVYALAPFRTAAERQGAGRTGASPGAPAVMAPSQATGRPSAPASLASSAPAGKSSASPGQASASPLASGPAVTKPSATAPAQPRTVRSQ
jgi:Protein of unknown function (DUF3040)